MESSDFKKVKEFVYADIEREINLARAMNDKEKSEK